MAGMQEHIDKMINEHFVPDTLLTSRGSHTFQDYKKAFEQMYLKIRLDPLPSGLSEIECSILETAYCSDDKGGRHAVALKAIQEVKKQMQGRAITQLTELCALIKTGPTIDAEAKIHAMAASPEIQFILSHKSDQDKTVAEIRSDTLNRIAHIAYEQYIDGFIQANLQLDSDGDEHKSLYEAHLRDTPAFFTSDLFMQSGGQKKIDHYKKPENVKTRFDAIAFRKRELGMSHPENVPFCSNASLRQPTLHFGPKWTLTDVLFPSSRRFRQAIEHTIGSYVNIGIDLPMRKGEAQIFLNEIIDRKPADLIERIHAELTKIDGDFQDIAAKDNAELLTLLTTVNGKVSLSMSKNEYSQLVPEIVSVLHIIAQVVEHKEIFPIDHDHGLSQDIKFISMLERDHELIKEGQVYAKDGLLYHWDSMSNRFMLATTVGGRFKIGLQDPSNDEHGLIITADEEIYVLDHLFGEKNTRGRIAYHSMITSGKPVLFSGSVKIKEGLITEISDDSGHYKPDDIVGLLAFLANKGLINGNPVYNPIGGLSSTLITQSSLTKLMTSPHLTPRGWSSIIKLYDNKKMGEILKQALNGLQGNQLDKVITSRKDILILAIGGGQIQTAELILQRSDLAGEVLSAKNKDGNNALMALVSKGLTNTAKLIIQRPNLPVEVLSD